MAAIENGEQGMEIPELQEEQRVSSNKQVHKKNADACEEYGINGVVNEWSNIRILLNRMTVYEMLHVSMDGCRKCG